MSEALISALAGTGLVGAFIAGGIFVYMHPGKAEKWGALILRLFSFVGLKFKRQAIKYDIQGSINSFVSRLARESELGEEAKGVKIKWAGKAEDDEVRWKDGEVVLVLKDRGQHNRNLIHAAYLFVSTSLLKDVKTHLSQKQSTAIDIFTTGKILEEENRPALNYFGRDIANPLLEDEKVKIFVEQFEDIDKSGFYMNILLQELHYLGGKVVFNARKADVHEEVAHLFTFLQQFAMREVGDDTVGDEFTGKFLRASIKIVSRAHVREAGRTHIPLERICRAFEKGIENVYVVGPHFDNGKEFIDTVCEAVRGRAPHLVIVRNRAFKGAITRDGQTVPAKTYMVQIQNQHSNKFLGSADIHKAIEEYRSEVAKHPSKRAEEADAV